MALSQQEIQEMEQVTGLKYSSPSDTSNIGRTRADEIRAMAPAPTPSFTDILQGKNGAPVTDGSKIVNHITESVKHPVETLKGVVKGAVGIPAEITKAVESVGKGAMNLAGIDTSNMGMDYNPVEEMTAPSNPAQETGRFIAGLLPVERAVTASKPIFSAIEKTLADRALIKGEKTTIEAVNPDLTGKKLNKAYEEVVTSKNPRTVQPSGIFTEQTLSPSDRAINLGKRLSKGDVLTDGTKIESVVLKDEPIQDLPVLRKAMVDTESKLQTALKGNPEIEYNADKQTLFKTLDDAITSAPEEYRIKDTAESKVYQSVFKFANKVAAKAEDSITGIRNARTSFDNQARIEYPSAFKDGVIDTKTPAGAAIKKARDIFNEHLYNTAPNGSDIQKLIGREADIYQATEPVAAKAAKGEGKTKVQKGVDIIREHPVASTAATAATTYAGVKAIGQ